MFRLRYCAPDGVTAYEIYATREDLDARVTAIRAASCEHITAHNLTEETHTHIATGIVTVTYVEGEEVAL